MFRFLVCSASLLITLYIYIFINLRSYKILNVKLGPSRSRSLYLVFRTALVLIRKDLLSLSKSSKLDDYKVSNFITFRLELVDLFTFLFY